MRMNNCYVVKGPNPIGENVIKGVYLTEEKANLAIECWQHYFGDGEYTITQTIFDEFGPFKHELENEQRNLKTAIDSKTKDLNEVFSLINKINNF